MLKCLGKLGPCHLINHIHVKKNLQKILKILKKINYEITHHILVGAVCYEKRNITGWGRQPQELLRSVLWTVDEHSLLCVLFFVLLVIAAVLVVLPLSCFAHHPSQISHHHLSRRFYENHCFILSCCPFLSFSDWVTCRWLKFPLQRQILSRLHLHQRCLNVLGWWSTQLRQRHTWHWPLCYDCWLICNLLKQVLTPVIQSQLEMTPLPVTDVSVCVYQPSEPPHPTEHTTGVYYPKRRAIITLKRMPAPLTTNILRQM